ncbi:peroxidase [Oryctes borbonicus]|uniref:Peroxidase n=1 Tax=Oryctes borbonicus TaxID=1629725 RepID=A0A0T6AUW6_9SCAR|nr:peroxidase [Oryctes borbonicus]
MDFILIIFNNEFQLTRYLFKAGNPFGLDLAAINIQRGRDHGLRPYNDYRQLIGLQRIEQFEEFGTGVLLNISINWTILLFRFLQIGTKLGYLYSTVDDIDLWVGGLLEPKDSDDSVLGPTFRDIVADQFSRLKKGDRYFFENGPKINPGYFTLGMNSSIAIVPKYQVLILHIGRIDRKINV